MSLAVEAFLPTRPLGIMRFRPPTMIDDTRRYKR